MQSTTEIIRENSRRKAVMYSPYDPITGLGSTIERVAVPITDSSILYLPKSMSALAAVTLIVKHGSIKNALAAIGQQGNELEFLSGLQEERLNHDFEFWAFTTVKIQDKQTKELIPFKLNRGQRKTLARLERMRLEGIPIRAILLKARQWGGSTLVQMYMAWIQVRLKKRWHSAIVADVEGQARNIRGMFTNMAKEYPLGPLTFGPYEGSSKNRVILERECVVGIGSAQEPDSLRSFDFSMLHESEVGLWKSTATRSAEALAQSLAATVPDFPYTLVVKESTAKGVGNYFHREWQAAVSGKSAYDPIFVAWWEIERYQIAVPDYKQFISTFKEYDWYLWEQGATLEGIAWYRKTKDDDQYDDWSMKSEYPSSADEAFQSTGRRAFRPYYVSQARKTCRKPAFIGDLFAGSEKGKEALQNITFSSMPKGSLKVWDLPDTEEMVTNRYCVFGDIGGRTDKADYSTLTVLDRYPMIEGGVSEVVASWRGHLDQDLFAWVAARVAKWYNNALLGIEVNSLNQSQDEGSHGLTVLDEIAKHYENLFTRTDPEKIAEGIPAKYGFHTNVTTKTMLIDGLNGALRDSGFVEREIEACDEYDYYEIKPNGSYGAVDGEHDDILMTRAGAYWLATSYMKPPAVIKKSSPGSMKKKIVNEATV